MRAVLAALLLTVAGIGAGCVPDDPADGFGRFEGRLLWLDEGGEKKELAEALTYVDPDGRRWTAPKGYRSDGATIPKWMLSLTGGRFEGTRLHAAVIHDAYCEEDRRKGARWQDVHRMFYFACRCRGVDETMAKILYAAVLLGGPRWDARSGEAQRWWVRCLPGFLRDDDPEAGGCEEDGGGGEPATPAEEDLGERALDISAWIQADAPDLASIEARAAR